MKRTVHLAWTEIRRSRWYIVAWSVVALAKVLVGGTDLFITRIGFDDVGSTIFALEVAEAIITFLMAASIVQGDPLIGTRAFWMTRPISRRRLLVGKALAIGAAGLVLPVLAYSTLWLPLGFGGRDLAWAAGETVARQLAVILPAMMVATLTDTFVRLIVWSVVLLIAFETGAVLLRSLATAQLITQVAVFTVAAGVVIVIRYLWRGWVAPIVGLLVGLGLAMGVAARTRPGGGFISGFGRHAESHPELAKDLTLTVRSATPSWMHARAPDVALDVGFNVSGVPAGVFVRAESMTHVIDWPSGLTQRFVGTLQSRYDWRVPLQLPEAAKDEETERWFREQQVERDRRAAAKGLPVWRYRKESPDAGSSIVMRRGIAALIPRLRPRYRFEAELSVIQPGIALEVPIQPGAQGSGAGYSVRVLSAKQQERAGRGPSVRTVLLLRGPALLRDRYLASRSPFNRELPQLVLLNRSLGNAMSIRGGSAVVRLAGIGIWRIDDTSSEPIVRRGDKWVPADPEFLDHASLAVMTAHEVARVVRKGEVEHLVYQEWER